MPITLNTIIYDIMGELQRLARGISGVQAPPPELYPTAIDTTNGQPFCMTVFGSGEGWQKGPGYSQGDYVYHMLVFLDPVAQSDIPSHVIDGALLYQQFMNTFLLSTNTALFNPGPYQATLQTGPTGPHVSGDGPGPTFTFRGVPYYGFQLSVPVRWQGPQV